MTKKRAVLLGLVVTAIAGCETAQTNGNPAPVRSKPVEPGGRTYSAERAAETLDSAQGQFVRDWQEAVPIANEQRLWLKDAAGPADAAGWVIFAPPEAGAKPERAFVEWYLARDEESERNVDGDSRASKQRAGRPLYALRRRTWRLSAEEGTKALTERLKGALPIVVQATDTAPVEAGKPRPALALTAEKTLATGLLGWNIEVYDPDPNDAYLGLFVELGESKIFPPSDMPVGAAAKAPELPRKLRSTGTLLDPDSSNGVRAVQREAVRAVR